MALTKPQFIETNANVITQEMIAWYEKASGKTLYPAQLERLLINLIAYRETLVRLAIADAAEQNLVAFARSPMLDYLGELVGVYRLNATKATTCLQFCAEAQKENVLIPAGTRVSATDSVIFATDEERILLAGETIITIPATCSEPGVLGNNWQPAKISTLLDDIAGLDVEVINLTPSSGGADIEDDEHFRARIKLAPESFTNAGSKAAYRFHAMSAHQEIVDVAVTRPQPGTVNLTVLMASGLPDENILSLVAAASSDEKVRPLTDTVVTVAPSKIEFAIKANLTLYSHSESQSILTQAREQVQAYADKISLQLGCDIVPSQIVSALSVPGVYQVELISPKHQILQAQDWAHCSDIVLNLKGIEHG